MLITVLVNGVRTSIRDDCLRGDEVISALGIQDGISLLVLDVTGKHRIRIKPDSRITPGEGWEFETRALTLGDILS